MAFSYSFHLSAKGHSVSTIGKVNQVSRHNLRAYKSDNFDRDLIEILSGSESSILDDVKQIYHEEFDEPLQKYNEGKREDRKIKDYLDHMSDSRGDVAVEIIIQVGDKDFWADKSIENRKKMTPVFKKQLDKLQELVPELKIASAVVHYDEASPHMHIVGVPIAEGYKKGLEKQVAKTKVFTADRLSVLQDDMRANAETEMDKVPELFTDMQLKKKEKGRNKDLPKSDLDKYEQLKTDIKDKEAEKTKLEGEIEKLQEKKQTLSEETKTGVEEEIKTFAEEQGQKAMKILEGDLKSSAAEWRNEIRQADLTANLPSKPDMSLIPTDKTVDKEKKAHYKLKGLTINEPLLGTKYKVSFEQTFDDKKTAQAFVGALNALVDFAMKYNPKNILMGLTDRIENLKFIGIKNVSKVKALRKWLSLNVPESVNVPIKDLVCRVAYNQAYSIDNDLNITDPDRDKKVALFDKSTKAWQMDPDRYVSQNVKKMIKGYHTVSNDLEMQRKAQGLVPDKKNNEQDIS